MSSPIALIGTAWRFYRKQPVLNEIAFWMFFLPVAFMDAFGGIIGVVEAQGVDDLSLASYTAMEIAVVAPLLVVLFYLLFWGQACVLTVAKRMVNSPAGRNRTSFKAVRKEARKFIGPLILTEILRTIITLGWALLLIVPGVIYSARTVFYDIMLIEEGKIAYGRPVLNKSKDIVTGRTWSVIWRMIVVSLLIFLPVAIVDGSISTLLEIVDPRLETLGLVLSDMVDSLAGVFYITCIVALYADLKNNPILSSSKA